MDFYFIQNLTLILLGIGAVIVYFFRSSAKTGSELQTILTQERCPKCGMENIYNNPLFEIDNRNGTGCSGTYTMNVACKRCGYAASFVRESGHSCSS